MWILVTCRFLYLNSRGYNICLAIISRCLNLGRYLRNYQFPHLNKKRMEKRENHIVFNFYNSYWFHTRQQEMFHINNSSPLVIFFDRVLLFYQWLVTILQRFKFYSYYFLFKQSYWNLKHVNLNTTDTGQNVWFIRANDSWLSFISRF